VDVFRAHVDAVDGQTSGSTAVTLVAVFDGVQDVGAYEAACVAVEPFGEAGWRGRHRAEAVTAARAWSAWSAQAQQSCEGADDMVQHCQRSLSALAMPRDGSHPSPGSVVRTVELPYELRGASMTPWRGVRTVRLCSNLTPPGRSSSRSPRWFGSASLAASTQCEA
jgi:hypothetical protein